MLCLQKLLSSASECQKPNLIAIQGHTILELLDQGGGGNDN
jgi:hypothetical protein